MQTNGVEEASVHIPSHSQTWSVMTLTYNPLSKLYLHIFMTMQLKVVGYNFSNIHRRDRPKSIRACALLKKNGGKTFPYILFLIFIMYN